MIDHYARLYGQSARFHSALETISKQYRFDNEHSANLEHLNNALLTRFRCLDSQEAVTSYCGNAISIVTAANDKYLNCALLLLESLRSIQHVSSVIIFDIGLSIDSIKSLEDSGINVTIARDLTSSREWRQSYIKHYRFKIEAAVFAPVYDAKSAYFLWIDSCCIVVNELDRVIDQIRQAGYFVCQPDERLAGVRMINHVPESFGLPILNSLASARILARQLVLYAVHGYSLHSQYYLNVIYEAFLLSMLVPASVEGEKFATLASEASRVRIENSHSFRESISFLDERKIYIRSRRWLGARHDLFLYSYLFYQENLCPLSQYGWIEDHDTEGLSQKNSEVNVIERQRRRDFERSMLWSHETAIVLHRGRFC